MTRMVLPVVALAVLAAYLPPGAQKVPPGVAQIGPGAFSGDGAGLPTSMCSVDMLYEQPGYVYTVSQIAEMVQDSEVVVRAVAVDSAGPLPHGFSWIRFRPTEVLRGPFPTAEVTLQGVVAKEDEFNTRSVPYQHVRPSGDGPCFASDYRIGGEYLFLLNRVFTGDLSPHWFPLGPTNEQIRGADDPWVQWVRDQLVDGAEPAGPPTIGNPPNSPSTKEQEP